MSKHKSVPSIKLSQLIFDIAINPSLKGLTSKRLCNPYQTSKKPASQKPPKGTRNEMIYCVSVVPLLKGPFKTTFHVNPVKGNRTREQRCLIKTSYLINIPLSGSLPVLGMGRIKKHPRNVWTIYNYSFCRL